MYLGLYNMYDKVRSAENTVFFLSSNQIGNVGDVYYCGHSRITRPTPIGEEAACTGWEEGIVFAEAEVQKEIEMYGRYPVLRIGFLRHMDISHSRFRYKYNAWINVTHRPENQMSVRYTFSRLFLKLDGEMPKAS